MNSELSTKQKEKIAIKDYIKSKIGVLSQNKIADIFAVLDQPEYQIDIVYPKKEDGYVSMHVLRYYQTNFNYKNSDVTGHTREGMANLLSPDNRSDFQRTVPDTVYEICYCVKKLDD